MRYFAISLLDDKNFSPMLTYPCTAIYMNYASPPAVCQDTHWSAYAYINATVGGSAKIIDADRCRCSHILYKMSYYRPHHYAVEGATIHGISDVDAQWLDA